MKKLISIVLCLALAFSLAMQVCALSNLNGSDIGPKGELKEKHRNSAIETKVELEKKYGVSIVEYGKAITANSVDIYIYSQIGTVETALDTLGTQFMKTLNSAMVKKRGKSLVINLKPDRTPVVKMAGDYQASYNTKTGTIDATEFDNYALIHEMGHAYHDAVLNFNKDIAELGKGSKYKGNKYRLSYSDYSSLDAYEKASYALYAKFTSEYASSSWMEDFAETFSYLLRDPEHNYVNQYYKPGQTVDAKYQYITNLLIKHAGEDSVCVKRAKKTLELLKSKKSTE